MPRYTYRCQKCGEFDDRSSMANMDDPKNCPGCGEVCPRIFVPCSISPNINNAGAKFLEKIEAADQGKDVRYHTDSNGKVNRLVIKG